MWRVQMSRIKHYSKSDLSYGHNLNKCGIYIDNFDSISDLENFNDIIELYNVGKIMADQIYLENWSSDQIQKYKEFEKEIKAHLGQSLNMMDYDKVSEYYSELERQYKKDFFILLETYGIHNIISSDSIYKIIDSSMTWKNEILVSPKFVKKFDTLICECLCKDENTAELLLNIFEVEHLTPRDKLYLPVSLDVNKKEAILSQYIKSDSANLNYVRLIANIQSNKDRLIVSAKTIKLARDKAIIIEEEIFKENQGLKSHIQLSFSDSLESELDVRINGINITADYSTKWIEENLDYPTLLNNFIYLFEYVDRQMRCSLVTLKNNMGVFERFMGVKSQFSYNIGYTFRFMNQLAIMQINAYYNQLLNYNIRLEEIIEWFFKDYLKSEFGVENYYISMPSTNSTQLEKCSSIMPAFESVLKQYCLYIEEGEIDHELLEIKTGHLFLNNIPSIVDRKYFYLNSKDANIACNILFSDQTVLGYLERLENEYDNLYNLIMNEDVKISDFSDYDDGSIEWLINHNLLYLDEDGYIDFIERKSIFILEDLYYNEVLSYWHYPLDYRSIIDVLHDLGFIRYENTLFSIPEQEYFDYHLNQARFNNGLDLRNKYSHTQVISIKNKDIHLYNYFQFLKLFMIMVIKINDEFFLDEYTKRLISD
jgi:hypothetical protein